MVAARHCAQDVVYESRDERIETPPMYDDSSHSGEIGLSLSPTPSPSKTSTPRTSRRNTGGNWLGADSKSNPRPDEDSRNNSRFPNTMEEESDTRETNSIPVHPNLLRNIAGSPAINGEGNLPHGVRNVDASAVANGSASNQAQLMEARMIQLEQTISTLSSVCKDLWLQQRHLMDQCGTSEKHNETRTNSDCSSPSTSPSTPENKLDTSEEDRARLAQWPPSHHGLLESPDIMTTKEHTRLSTGDKIHLRGLSLGSSSLNSAQNAEMYSADSSLNSSSGQLLASNIRHALGSGGQLRRSNMPYGKNGKTMSMVLLDINPDESRGPNMIHLDPYEELDAESLVESRSGSSSLGRSDRSKRRRSSGERKGGRQDGRSSNGDKGNDSETSNESLNDSSSSNDDSLSTIERDDHRSKRDRPDRRLSSSMFEKPATGQVATTSGVEDEAVRLRRYRERAYSLNDAGVGSGNTAFRQHIAADNKENRLSQWSSSLDVQQEGNEESPRDGSAIKSITSASNEELYTAMPILSATSSRPESKLPKPREESGYPSEELRHVDSNKDVKTIGSGATGMTHSLSYSSNMSSVSTNTIKTRNVATSMTPQAQMSKQRTSSVSSSGSTTQLTPMQVVKRRPSTSSSPFRDKRDRSSSIASSRDEYTTPMKDSAENVREYKGGATRGKRDRLLKSSKSPDVKSSQQTMKSFFINDLLNIDSRNQDGSATEDIDENMEEFLRIPGKLEFLMIFSLGVCMDSFLYAWAMLPLKFLWGWVCLGCTLYSPSNGIGGVKFHRRHLYPLMQSALIWLVYSQVLCPISIGKLYHWIRGQAMLKLYVLIAIVEVFDRLLCSFGQDAWDSLYWNTTRRPWHPRMLVSMIVVTVYATIHSLFLFVHVATLSVAVNSADNALLTLLISGNFAEIKSTVFKKYNKQNLFKITTSDICERFKLALFLMLILFLNRFQGDMTASMVKDYYTMCGVVFAAELVSDWIKHSFITKFNMIKSTTYFDYALVLSGDVTGIGHEGLNLDCTHAAVKRLGLAQIPLVCVTARYLHEAVRFAIENWRESEQGYGPNQSRWDYGHPISAMIELTASGNEFRFYSIMLQCLGALIIFKITLGILLRFVARWYLGAAGDRLKSRDRERNKNRSTASKSTPR